MADTQGAGGNIFRQSAMSRMMNSDDLDKYIKVTNPSIWMVVLAAVLLVGGLVVWSATAIIPTTIQTTGFVRNGDITCWVDKAIAAKIEEGGVTASVDGERATNVTMGDVPLSEAEVKATLGSDYAANAVDLDVWNYEVIMKFSEDFSVPTDAHMVPVNITVLEMHPLNLVFGNGR